MGKWCLHAFDSYESPLNEKAQIVLKAVEHSFYITVNLPVTDGGKQLITKMLKQTVGRVLVTEIPEERIRLFLIDTAARVGRLATHMARELHDDEIDSSHIEAACRVVFEKTDKIVQRIIERAA